MNSEAVQVRKWVDWRLSTIPGAGDAMLFGQERGDRGVLRRIVGVVIEDGRGSSVTFLQSTSSDVRFHVRSGGIETGIPATVGGTRRRMPQVDVDLGVWDVIGGNNGRINGGNQGDEAVRSWWRTFQNRYNGPASPSGKTVYRVWTGSEVRPADHGSFARTSHRVSITRSSSCFGALDSDEGAA